MMKKFCAVMTAVSMMICAPAAALAYDVKYTSDGRLVNADVLYYDHAFVTIDSSLFENLIRHDDGYDHEYACYGSGAHSMTLTLGRAYYTKGNDYNERIREYTQDQIRYINSIGGVMTGYTYEYDSFYPKLRISWNVGSEHHYACMKTGVNPFYLGYYDLKYTDNDNPSELINRFNDTIHIVFGPQ